MARERRLDGAGCSVNVQRLSDWTDKHNERRKRKLLRAQSGARRTGGIQGRLRPRPRGRRLPGDALIEFEVGLGLGLGQVFPVWHGLRSILPMARAARARSAASVRRGQ
jgi:hypothetical protein